MGVFVCGLYRPIPWTSLWKNELGSKIHDLPGQMTRRKNSKPSTIGKDKYRKRECLHKRTPRIFDWRYAVFPNEDNKKEKKKLYPSHQNNGSRIQAVIWNDRRFRVTESGLSQSAFKGIGLNSLKLVGLAMCWPRFQTAVRSFIGIYVWLVKSKWWSW